MACGPLLLGVLGIQAAAASGHVGHECSLKPLLLLVKTSQGSCSSEKWDQKLVVYTLLPKPFSEKWDRVGWGLFFEQQYAIIYIPQHTAGFWR